MDELGRHKMFDDGFSRGVDFVHRDPTPSPIPNQVAQLARGDIKFMNRA